MQRVRETPQKCAAYFSVLNLILKGIAGEYCFALFDSTEEFATQAKGLLLILLKCLNDFLPCIRFKYDRQTHIAMPSFCAIWSRLTPLDFAVARLAKRRSSSAFCTSVIGKFDVRLATLSHKSSTNCMRSAIPSCWISSSNVLIAFTWILLACLDCRIFSCVWRGRFFYESVGSFDLRLLPFGTFDVERSGWNKITARFQGDDSSTSLKRTPNKNAACRPKTRHDSHRYCVECAARTRGRKMNGLKMRKSGETVRMAHHTGVCTLRLLIFALVFQ